jgi:sulfotransferase
MKTAVGRLQIFIADGQPVGRAFNAVRDAVTRGWRNQMMFVEFEALTRQPKKTLAAAYAFLGLPAHKHDFDNVEQITHEDDSTHGFKDLHTIRQKVEPMEPQWSSVHDGTVLREPVWKRVEACGSVWKSSADSGENTSATLIRSGEAAPDWRQHGSADRSGVWPRMEPLSP